MIIILTNFILEIKASKIEINNILALINFGSKIKKITLVYTLKLDFIF